MREKRRVTSQSRAVLLTSREDEEDFILAVWFGNVNRPDVPGKIHLPEPARIDSANQCVCVCGGGRLGALKEEKGIETTNVVRLVQIVILGMVPDRKKNRKLQSSHFQQFYCIAVGRA